MIGAKLTNSSSDPPKYWTEERIKEALRHQLSLIRDGQPTLQGSVPGGDRVQVSPPSNPSRDATPVLPRLPSGRKDAQFACPVTRFEWSHETNNRDYPQRVVGVLFFEDASGNPFVCSASLVNKKVLLTAGHCVGSGRGQWHKNFMWAPGYLEGNFPYGQVLSEYALTFTEWFNNQNFSFDVAFMILAEPKGDDLGARDCNSGQPCTIAVGSPLTGGSSGGPWIYQQDGGNYANGLNSYKYTNCASNMYSPYFGQDVWNLFQNAISRQ